MVAFKAAFLNDALAPEVRLACPDHQNVQFELSEGILYETLCRFCHVASSPAALRKGITHFLAVDIRSVLIRLESNAADDRFCLLLNNRPGHIAPKQLLDNHAGFAYIGMWLPSCIGAHIRIPGIVKQRFSIPL